MSLVKGVWGTVLELSASVTTKNIYCFENKYVSFCNIQVWVDLEYSF